MPTSITTFWRVLLIAIVRNAKLLGHFMRPRRLLAGSNRLIIVFDIGTVGLREHATPVIEWLLDNSSAFIILVLSEEDWKIGPRMRFAGEATQRLCRLNRSDYRLMPLTPHVTVSLHPETGTCLRKRLLEFGESRTQRVVMQHGLSDKAAFSDLAKTDTLSDFDVVFLVGPIFREGSLKEYALKYPDTFARLRFIDVGAPKTDELFRPRKNKTSLLNELGLDPSKPTVCYAPTWERWASLEQCGGDIIESISQMEVNCIVKLHHLSLQSTLTRPIMKKGHGGKNWAEIIGRMEQRFPNLRLARGQDANPYLIASDILVSDVSGVAFEFVLLDKPVVFFDVPGMFDYYGKNGIHFWGRECGDIVKSLEELTRAIRGNLENPRHKSTERQKWGSLISYSQGDAARRAGEAILTLAREQGNGRSAQAMTS